MGFPPPNHPWINRVFHYFHHPFWGSTEVYLLKSEEFAGSIWVTLITTNTDHGRANHKSGQAWLMIVILLQTSTNNFMIKANQNTAQQWLQKISPKQNIHHNTHRYICIYSIILFIEFLFEEVFIAHQKWILLPTSNDGFPKGPTLYASQL